MAIQSSTGGAVRTKIILACIGIIAILGAIAFGNMKKQSDEDHLIVNAAIFQLYNKSPHRNSFSLAQMSADAKPWFDRYNRYEARIERHSPTRVTVSFWDNGKFVAQQDLQNYPLGWLPPMTIHHRRDKKASAPGVPS